MAYRTINPFTNETLATFPDLTDAELAQKLDCAQATYKQWSKQPFSARAAIVGRAAQLLRQNNEHYARLLTLEMGKLYRESLAEVELSADILQYYADHAEEFLAPQKLTEKSGRGDNAMLVSQPLGIVFAIEPWNFPYYQLARVVGPQFMAGNVVVVKHASNVPQSAAAFEQLFRDAGAPEGLYTNLYATRDQLGEIIADDRVIGVALTGSEGAGAIVAAQAGKALKKTTMELGGSDAFIVLDDADMEKAVKWAVWGRMNNGGQCCVASKRIIVADAIADEFLDRFETALAKLVPGDPMDEKSGVPPLSSQAAADQLNDQVALAVKHGAIAIRVGEAPPETGAFVQTTILTGVTAENPIFHQELFGPVAMFFRVGDDEEAIALANDNPYGLGGSVFTSDTARGVRVAEQIETGMVYINHPTWTTCDLPFGGVKRSGFGRELSSLGIQEFVNKKLIDVVPIDAAP
ncbi:succinate-semialdehyde dehydrogenase [Komagataeibacter xylinus]|uniref:Succinate-semialdehyde dehydrogenase n=1 Tax=Komagataeibacter xylinus TaxID=28448 RepID=A0A318PS28_KOMXY|nr:NAD-dependent succinate-semialdehyde dehydrogenase [Komagataeibacter xylinus]AZV37831.1 NAD-dependent succinate-semialdehyde dehydrogenase [Komagataeibacter xylinus]PYD56293.1 succinate-semialdehyde dehydrogenase [Komagataeibacter xylinus]GBQ68842.1 aldehyde dehydrogenase [Komagataeibacter xylinus NBRC 15237]